MSKPTYKRLSLDGIQALGDRAHSQFEGSLESLALPELPELPGRTGWDGAWTGCLPSPWFERAGEETGGLGYTL